MGILFQAVPHKMCPSEFVRAGAEQLGWCRMRLRTRQVKPGLPVVPNPVDVF